MELLRSAFADVPLPPLITFSLKIIVKGYHGRLKPKRYLRLKALDFEFDPNYFLRPLASTYVGVSRSAVICFKDSVVKEEEEAAVNKTSRIPIKDIVARVCRKRWALLILFLLHGCLAVAVILLVAVCVTLHERSRIRQGDLGVPER